MIAMKWTVDTGRTGWEVSLRLDAFDEDERIKQLDEGRTWALANIQSGDVVILGGDKNFARSTDEKQSSSNPTWKPSERMNAA